MQNKEYMEYLTKKYSTNPNIINEHISILDDFESFLAESRISSIDAADYDTVMSYSKKIAETSNDIKKVLSILQDYGIYTNQKAIVSAMFEFFEAPAVPAILSQHIKETLGEERWSKIMSGIDTPVISFTPDQRSNYMRNIMSKLNVYTDESTECKIFKHVSHGLTRSYYKSARDEFIKYKNIDKFLEISNQEFLNDLIKHRDSERLFYGQPIDNRVIDYLKSDPKFWWKRHGSEIHITKMPYRTLDYLNAGDIRMKQYYACHCPWARKSIIQKEGPVRKSICSCSLSLTKMYIEAALDRALEAENIETVLDGKSLFCTTAIHIPADILEEYI